MKTWKTKSGYTITKVLAGRSNAFLVSNGIVNVMVDTGPARNRKRLQRNLNRLHIEKIDLLLLTHTHYDHAGSAGQIKRTYNATVAVHAREKSFLETGHNILPKGTIPITKLLMNLLGKRLSGRFTYDPCQPDILIEAVRPLNDFGLSACVLPTPGHSPGSVSLIVDDEIAIVGDAMFGIFKGSIFPPFADDTAMMIRSWKVLLDTGCRTFLPAHGYENSRGKVEKNLRDAIPRDGVPKDGVPAG